MAKSTLPLKASSSTATAKLGEAIAINPFANAGVTATDAPVLLSLESDYTLNAETFAARMVKNGGQGSEAQARLALNGTEMVMEDLVDTYGAVTVQTPFGTVETFIAGTVEHAQDQPDPATNYAFLGVVVPESYRKLFAQIETYVPTDAQPVALKRIRDKATGKPGIYGTKTFYLEGRGMNYGGTGTKLELQNFVTREKICDITVDAASKSTVQLACSLPGTAAIAAGTYWIELTSLNAGHLLPVGIKTELIEAVVPAVPTITKVTQEGREDNVVVLHGTSACSIIGTNLALAAGDAVKIVLNKDGTQYDTGVATVASSTDTTINITGFAEFDTSKYSEWVEMDADTKIIVNKTTGTATQAVQFMIGS